MSTQYNRIVLSGLIAATQSWSVGMSFGASDGTSDPITDYTELENWAEQIGALNSGHVLPDNLNGLVSSLTSLTTVRAETLTAAGVLTEAAEFQCSPAFFGSSTPKCPPQTALVTSIETGRPGRSFAGRIYWPALGAAIQPNTARLDDSDATSYASDTETLLAAIAAAAPSLASLVPVVASAKLGLQTRISSIKVGTVLDTQRRRRDKLTEQYVSVSYSG